MEVAVKRSAAEAGITATTETSPSDKRRREQDDDAEMEESAENINPPTNPTMSVELLSSSGNNMPHKKRNEPQEALQSSLMNRVSLSPPPPPQVWAAHASRPTTTSSPASTASSSPPPPPPPPPQDSSSIPETSLKSPPNNEKHISNLGPPASACKTMATETETTTAARTSTTDLTNSDVLLERQSSDPKVKERSLPRSTTRMRSLLQKASTKWGLVSAATVLLMLTSGAVMVMVQGLFPPPPHLPNNNGADEVSQFLAQHKHILPPQSTRDAPMILSPTETLRTFLENSNDGFSLAFSPAFFGFFGYFGALAALDEKLVIPSSTTKTTTNKNSGFLFSPGKIKSLAGASAGAMAAVLLAAGIPPRVAAEFCSTVTLDKFADFPGLLGIFRGNLFEQLMRDFLLEHVPGSQEDASLLLLQNAKYPVAVTGFCLQSMRGKILRTGSMARAARASATFPLLFEPVGWLDDEGADYTLIDGGLNDTAGVVGLESFDTEQRGDRVVNLKVGPFWETKPPGPSQMEGVNHVLSISLQNLPQCSPLAMELGPVAVQAAYDAIEASLDLPLFVNQNSTNHYELHIDTSQFWK